MPLLGCNSDDQVDIQLEPGEFVLQAGDQKIHDDVTFILLSISEDRCPSDVVCVRFGEATVDLMMVPDEGIKDTLKMCIGDCMVSEQSDSIVFSTISGEYVLRFLDVRPYPTTQNEHKLKSAVFRIDS